MHGLGETQQISVGSHFLYSSGHLISSKPKMSFSSLVSITLPSGEAPKM